MSAFSPFASHLNGVGYNTTANEAGDSSFIIGASFSDINFNGVVPFANLTSPEGIEDGDQIQSPYIDSDGLTQQP